MPTTERQPFRPLLNPPEVSWTDADNRLEVHVRLGKKVRTYSVSRISTDLGGVAVRLHKGGAEPKTYDVLLAGGWSTCDCAGFVFTDSCCHVFALKTLVDAGVLKPAPASAATEELDDAAF